MNIRQKEMYAGVVHARQDIRYEKIPVPQLKDDEVLAEVYYTGICGSDVPRVNADACHFFPNVLGHEFSGVIADVGKNVSQNLIGQRAVGIPLVPCMECEDCRKGNYSLCRHYSFIGSRRFGSFAQYVAVPAANILPITEETDFKTAAFFEPSTVAVHGIRCADFYSGGTVLILGGGTIGLLVLQWAKILGAGKTIVVNRSREKLNYALTLGADAVISTLDADYKEQLAALTDQRGFDFVFETAGSAQMMEEAFGFVANKGCVCCIGTPKKSLTFSVSQWELLNRREFRLTGSWMSYSSPFPGEEWELTSAHMRDGSLKILPEMIDEVIPLSRIDYAFEKFRKGTVSGKILIDSHS